MFLLLAVSLFLNIGGNRAFFPNRLTSIQIGETTFTHQDITEIGILRAVAAYFEDNPRSGSDTSPGKLTDMKDITSLKLFQQYYGEQATGARLQEVVNSIVTANNWLYKEYFDRALLHCNGETIREANELMTTLREDIIDVLLQDNPNFDLASELTGQFLHMMQMFYSNTNWVELFGSNAYYTLGIRGKPIFAQATPLMMTCSSCGELIDIPCNNTLILDGIILTSGYRSDQDIEKPFRHPDEFRNGKCSHGGPFDQSGVAIAAVGGINKDSVRSYLSPHYYLHQMAAQAAINHTLFFFNDKDYGLRYIIGDDKYQQFLQMKAGSSLVFTIDYTGSMRDDIEAVKEQVVAITQDYLGTIYEPSNYIVVLFNDPASLTTIFQSKNSEETLDYIRNITVSGGGDCPEYAMGGIEKALSVCHPNSRMYIFTDAPAKDPEKETYVKNLATQKNVELLFFVTNGCSRRKRREIADEQGSNLMNRREKRSTNKENLYRALATATGGSLYVTNKGGISQLANIIRETVTESVTILKKSIASTRARDVNITILVDNTIRELTMEVTGSSTVSTETYNPSGERVDGNVTDLGVGYVIKIYNVIPGEWQLNLQDSTPLTALTVKVTAHSTLDISSIFVQMDPKTGFEYEIIGRPVAGDNATIVMFVPSKDLINSLDMIQLLNSEGDELARYDQVTPVAGRADTGLYRVQFPLPTQDFQVSLSGEDSDGNRYTRLQNRKIVPVAIHLFLLPTNENLYVNESVTMNFVVVNRGGNTSDITVAINNDQNFDQSPLDYQFELDPSHNATGNFTLQSGPEPGVITTVTVTATTDFSTGDNSQFIIRRLFTKMRIIRPEDYTPPVCNITSITGNCDTKKLDPCTCSQYKWSGIADVGDDGFGLYQISSSVKNAGNFSHDRFNEGHTFRNGTIQASIGSTCCNPRIYITVVDMASNTGLCVFDLAPEQELPLPECKPTVKQDPEVSETTLLIIAAASGAGALVILIIIIAIICIVAKKKKTKKSDDNMCVPRPNLKPSSRNRSSNTYF